MACFNIRGALFAPLIVIIVFLCQTCLCFNLDGSPGSYAKFDHWEPCINGSLSFEFKTDRPNALLFYIDDGHSSFFELKLVGGIARLRLNLGGGTVILSAGQSLNDQQWHKVEIRRNGEQTTLTVDKIEHTRTLHGNEFDLNSTDDRYFFIGGLPDDYDQKLTTLALPSVIFEPKFRGSIRNLFYSSCAGPVERPTMINHDGILSSDEDLCERGNPCLNGGMCLTTDDGLMCDCTRIEFDGDRCETEKIPSDATFLGAQYFSYDLSSRGDPIISNNDQLSLDFRTKQSNGLLFFTGDSNDYLNVAMKDGGIILTINLGSGSYETEVRPGHVRFDDNRWHHLLIKREAREISMEVDGVYRKSGSTTGEFTLLSSSVLYVAGSPNTVLLPGSRVKSNFKGCMRKVRYQADNVQLDLTDLAKKSHGLISVVGEVLFNRCQELVESHPITFLTPKSYITLPTWDVSLKRASIAFQFQTTEPNGVILYNSGQLAKSDFFAIELLDGHLYLVINLGSGTMKVKASKQPVNDGEPHEVYLDYQGPQGYITLDGQKEPYTSKEKGDLLQLDGYLFVGAINDHVDASTLPKEMWSGMLGHGYVGCFQDLVINGNKVDLVAAATLQLAEGIAEYCRRMEPQCLSYPCMHQGICVEGWNRFVCDCRATGFIDNVCQTASTTLRYDGTQYVKISMPEESLTEAEDISLRFRTMHPNGLLFMTSSDKTTDVMELYLDSGSIKLNVDVGSGAKSLTVGNVLNDDRWHTVFIKRRAQTIELAIDGHRPVTEKLPGQENTLSTRYIVLGYKDRVIPGDLPGEADELEFRNIDLGQEMKDDNSVGDHSGFIGSMQQLMFNQNYFFELAKSGRIENIEVTAKFSTDDYVVRDPVTFKAASAFATLPCLHAYKKFSLSFQFKTTEDSGLVLFNSGRGQDFFAIELNGGYLYYIYNMGAGAQSIQINSNQKLNNNKWHEVRLLRPELHKQLIRVDDNTPTVDNLGGSQALHFDLEGSLFVGGVLKTMYHSLPKVITSRHGFLGCLGSLDLNGYLPNLVKEADTIHQSIVEGCKGPTTQCQPDSCANEGRCVQQWNSYVCDCDSTSYSGPTCSDESTSYRFGPTEGLLTFSYPAYQQPNTVGDNLALGFTTYSKDAVLVRIDSENFDDYIEMELVNGNIFVVYNMGTADHPIGELFKPVNDGKYHVVRFTRSGPNATIQVDDLMMQTKNPRGQQLGVFNNQAFVYVGGKKTEDGVIARPFEGTISGLVMNGIRILDLAEADDSRITKEKSVYLEHSGALSAKKKITKDNLPNKDVTEMQSTMGIRKIKESDVKYNGISRNISSVLDFNPKHFRHLLNKVARIKKRRHILENKRKHWLELNLVHSIGDQIILKPTSIPNIRMRKTELVKTKNTRQISEDKDVKEYLRTRHRIQPGTKAIIHNHLVKYGYHSQCAYDVVHEDPKDFAKLGKMDRNKFAGELDNRIEKFNIPRGEEMNENAVARSRTYFKETMEPTYVVEGSGGDAGDADDTKDTDDEQVPEGEYDNDLLKPDEETESNSVELWNTEDEFPDYESQNNIGVYESEEEGEEILAPTFFPLRQESDSTVDWFLENFPTTSVFSVFEGSSQSFLLQTTPKLGVTDDIIFSGAGAGCHSDDEDDCTSVGSGIEDDIITPTVIIKTTPHPPTTTPRPRKRPITCVEPDCNSRTKGNGDIFGPTPDPGYTDYRGVTPVYGMPNSLTPTGETSKESVGSGIGATLNIGLIIGIAAGVLVALLILIFALYKFRTRSEGTYKVDESQNFSYLESKKQQGNGALLGANENNKRGGKKKDVKEWYV